MAGTYTNSASGAGMRYGMHAYIKVVVTDTSNTVCRVRVECWAVSDGGYSGFIDGRCSAYAGGSYGSWTGHDQDVTAGGSTRLNYAEFNVDRGSSNKTVTYWAQIRGTSTSSSNYYYGCSESVSVNATIPKISTEKPNAPTNCSATYVSDSSVSVSWTNGSTTSTKPRTATLVERSTDGGAWVQIASASSSASNYSDNGTSSNHSYAYRVCATNGAGKSAYSTAQGVIYTTPAAPSSVTLEKTSATTVQVGIEGAPPYATGYNVERTQDGTTWANVGTGVSLPLQDTVSGGTVRYRVAAVNGSLVSPWAVSEAIVTICPPLAPTIIQQPSNPTVAGSGAIIAWTPNHPDGTSQSAAEVKVTNPGGTSTTYSVSTATSYSFTPNATGTWTAQVRTKGLDPSYGEWSQTVSWAVANPPAVVITSPATDGTDVVSLPMNVSWSVTDSTGVSTQRIIIEGSDGEILNRTLAGDVRTVALNASDVALENGQTYTISLRVMGGSGLVTEQTRIFDVAWLAPAAPVLQLTEGEGMSATIDVMDTHYSESGSIISVDGSAIADSFTVFGKSTQDGTPTPGAPVEIRSVEPTNVLPTPYKDGTKTVSGVTFTPNEDGTITASGTATGNGYYVLFGGFANVEPLPSWLIRGETYTMYNGRADGANDHGTMMIYFYNGSSTVGTYVQRKNATFTVPSTATHVGIFLRVLNGNALNYTFSPRINRGTLVLPYSPYGTLGVSIKDADNVTTTYPIDLQGNSLRSLPDGTCDELRVGGGNAVLVKRCEETQQAVTDGVTGTVGVDVLSSTGQIENDAQVVYKLAAPQEIDLGSVSDYPFIPEDGEMWIDGTTMDAVLRPADYAGQPTIQSVDVQRVNADGTAWTVATGLTVGGSCIDPLPPLGVEVVYIATASAASGATASERYTATIGGRTWALNAGAAAQEHMELRYNPQASYAMEHGGESYHFADGGAGGGRPVFYPTTDRDESGTLKFDTVDKDDTDALRAMSDRNPVMWLRDPFGHRWRAHVRPSSSHGVGRIWQLSIAWDAVRMKEAW